MNENENKTTEVVETKVNVKEAVVMKAKGFAPKAKSFVKGIALVGLGVVGTKLVERVLGKDEAKGDSDVTVTTYTSIPSGDNNQ